MNSPLTTSSLSEKPDSLAWESRKARVCMPSGRNFKKKAFYGGHYEAQDVLVESDDVDLICLETGWRYEQREFWQRRLMYRDISRKVVLANPGLQKVRLNQEYDLFIALCQTYKDLLHVNAIEGWKDHCKVTVCWIDEMWAALVPEQKYWLHFLGKFDHVFIGRSGAVEPISDAIGKKCKWLPGAVDALRFSPYPQPPDRVIDVYSIGRRCEGIHKSLLEAARRRDLFYVHDTSAGSLADVYDHRQHRENFANIAKRSRCFMVAPGKVDALEETRCQSEVGYRYTEGAAAGAIMIGQIPQCDAFSRMFPWQDAVIEVNPDGSDVLEVLRELRSDPDRIASITTKNATEALVRHDWIHRWMELYAEVGVAPSRGMAARKSQLQSLSEERVNQAEAAGFVQG
jgi:hypothetical protein